MNSLTEWMGNQYALVAGFAGVFGLIGLRRGVRRELILLAALLLAIVGLGRVADALEGPIDRAYYLQRFAVEGGLSADDPSTVWQEVSSAPELIQSEGNRSALKLGLFAVVIALAYLAGGRFAQGRSGTLDGLLGLPVGCLNGVAVIYFLLPILFPEPGTVVQLSSADAQSVLSGASLHVNMLIVLVIVLIGYGLFSASGHSRGEG